MPSIENEHLRVEIATWRAELMSITDCQGRNYLWSGDPAKWNGKAPILFPIVGMVPGNSVLIEGTPYTLVQHGFAPRSEFTLVSATATECHFQLTASDVTRAQYPFEFVLDVRFILHGNSLVQTARVTNPNDRPMPFSFGFHPGFAWPLPDAGAKADHRMIFSDAETAPSRRPQDGLLALELSPPPVVDRVLTLTDELFGEGAVMFDELASSGLVYGSDTGPSLAIEWTNLPHLAIWNNPGADYVCVEPWQGYSAPVGFAGELADKPGIRILPPGQTADFSMTVTVRTDQSALGA